MTTLTERGTVKLFDATRGYGFIIPNSGGPDVMFHSTVCAISRNMEIGPGMAVLFDKHRSDSGGWRASQVRLAKPPAVCPCCGRRGDV